MSIIIIIVIIIIVCELNGRAQDMYIAQVPYYSNLLITCIYMYLLSISTLVYLQIKRPLIRTLFVYCIIIYVF